MKTINKQKKFHKKNRRNYHLHDKCYAPNKKHIPYYAIPCSDGCVVYTDAKAPTLRDILDDDTLMKFNSLDLPVLPSRPKLSELTVPISNSKRKRERTHSAARVDVIKVCSLHEHVASRAGREQDQVAGHSKNYEGYSGSKDAPKDAGSRFDSIASIMESFIAIVQNITNFIS